MALKDKIKDKINENVNTAKVVWKNFLEFTDATCLAVVSGYAIYEALHHKGDFWYMALILAASIIAVQAFVLFVRHLNKPGTK
jgi:hypothetical protein